ncbi:MAG: hypothetical protein RKE49_01730 [Oceanicaulis sp.]
MLLSLHIPKTAGTAWRLHIEANAGRAALFDSVEASDSGDPAQSARALMEAGRTVEAREAIEASGARLIHGHRAGDFSTLFPDAPVMAFLREPRQRLAAEFVHVRNRPRAEPLFAAVHKGDLDFAEFAQQRGPIYSGEFAAGGAPRIAFLTEAPADAEQAFADALGWRGAMMRRNVAPPAQQSEAAALIDDHRPLLERVLAADLELYETWRSRWASGEAHRRARDLLPAGPRRARVSPLARARRRAGALKEAAGRLIGADWR